MMLTRSLAATVVVSLVMASAGRVLAGGAICGNTGGNEKAVWLYQRGVGEIRWAFTTVDGLYRFEGLDPAAYLIHGPGGGVIALVEVEEGKTATLDFAEQPHYSLSSDVWSPARREFGQTFAANGTSLTRIEWWIPGPRVRLGASVHEGGPGGPQIGPTVETKEPVSWFAGLGWAEGAVALTPGKTYYVRIYSLDGTKWNIGMPGPGDVVPNGMAYFDGEPQPDSDLALNIGESGRHPWVSTGHGGGNLGFISEGPGSGNCLSAGQTFVATRRNVLMASTDAGWGGDPWSTQFQYAIYEDGPGGKQIGPTCKVGMVSDWGTTAAWFPDDIPLEPGKRYYLKYWRTDGKPFYSYLSKDVYPHGTAFRDDKPMPEFDLSFNVEGEATLFSICWPYSIRPTQISATQATIEWHTGAPSISQIEYGETDYDHVTPASTDLTKHHRVKITGLRPGVGYVYRLICDTRVPGSKPLRSRGYQFMTAVAGEDRPAMLEPPSPPPPTPPLANAVRLVNASFEEGAKGWRQVAKSGAATGAVDGYLPHSGKSMWGWHYQYESRRGQRILDQTSTYDLLYQTIDVEPGRTYVFSGWILTGDRGSGWGRDSRVRLIVDTSARAEFPDLEHVDDSNATQWFATRDRWLRARVRFKATGDRAVVGFHFWQWWFLEADYLFVDDAQVIAVGDGEAVGNREPIAIEGFGANTTGGWGDRNHKTIHVTSLADDGLGSLREAVAGDEPKVVVFDVDGMIVLNDDVAIGSNTSIDGRGRCITITGGALSIREVSDVIVINLTIRDCPGDGIEIRASHNVVIDHCSLASCGDGLIDIVHGSDGVTVAWCKFERHDKTMLIGSGDRRGDVDKNLRVTIHHCFFDRTRQRHPRIRFGRIDTYNNYLYHWGSYGMESACDGELLVESNIFEAGDSTRAVVYAEWAGFGRAVGNLTLNGAEIKSSEPDRVFERPYPANIEPADDALREKIKAQAGATLAGCEEGAAG